MAGSDGSSLPTQSHFTATPGDQAFEPLSGFESPTLSITSRAGYRLSHHATTTCSTRAKISCMEELNKRCESTGVRWPLSYHITSVISAGGGCLLD